MTKDNNAVSADVYSLFHSAVAEMEAGHKLWRKKEFELFVVLLQGSATYLARSLLTARAGSVLDDKTLAELMSALHDSSDSDHPVYKSILDVLSFDVGTDINRENLKTVYAEYQSALINARKILVRDLAYNDNIWQKNRQILFTQTGRKRLALVSLPLIVLITLSLGIYHYIDPIDRFEVDGQIFWKSRPKVPFSSQDSVRFPVIADNQSREYAIPLESPVNIFLLRIDPVNAIGLTEIEIESISLQDNGGVLLRKIVFDNSMYWSCDNCVVLEKKGNTYRMRPSTNDPYMTSSAINQDGVKNITIKMRAVSKKTFWEWGLGIDKNMEF